MPTVSVVGKDFASHCNLHALVVGNCPADGDSAIMWTQVSLLFGLSLVTFLWALRQVWRMTRTRFRKFQVYFVSFVAFSSASLTFYYSVIPVSRFVYFLMWMKFMMLSIVALHFLVGAFRENLQRSHKKKVGLLAGSLVMILGMTIVSLLGAANWFPGRQDCHSLEFLVASSVQLVLALAFSVPGSILITRQFTRTGDVLRPQLRPLWVMAATALISGLMAWCVDVVLFVQQDSVSCQAIFSNPTWQGMAVVVFLRVCNYLLPLWAGLYAFGRVTTVDSMSPLLASLLGPSGGGNGLGGHFPATESNGSGTAYDSWTPSLASSPSAHPHMNTSSYTGSPRQAPGPPAPKLSDAPRVGGTPRTPGIGRMPSFTINQHGGEPPTPISLRSWASSASLASLTSHGDVPGVPPAVFGGTPGGLQSQNTTPRAQQQQLRRTSGGHVRLRSHTSAMARVPSQVSYGATGRVGGVESSPLPQLTHPPPGASQSSYGVPQTAFGTGGVGQWEAQAGPPLGVGGSGVGKVRVSREVLASDTNLPPRHPQRPPSGSSSRRGSGQHRRPRVPSLGMSNDRRSVQ